MRVGQISSHVIRYADTNDHGNLRQTVLVRVETASPCGRRPAGRPRR